MAGRGRLVLLGGEAGIGKTTLARDLAAEATARGARVLTGACYDLTNTPPYGPWLDLFDACALDRDLPPPPAAFAGGRLSDVTDQAALFAEVRAFFAALAATGPALLLLEDLHWADPASLELLRHLAPRLRHWPILLLVTYRGDELTRRHPFAVQLPALVREADGLRLDLQRLDATALRALVAARYRLPGRRRGAPGRLPGPARRGQPVVRDRAPPRVAGGSAASPSRRWLDAWRARPRRAPLLPPARDRAPRRPARRGDTQPLAIAAVIGQEVPLALWAEVADLDDEALLTIVERAVDAHLLEADPDGRRVRFVHALTREALYAGVLPPRRRLWHRRVGEALAAGTRPDPDAVAYHFQAAGDPRAGEWLLAAGDRAQRAYAWLTAAERLRAAAALLEDVEGQERTRGRLACRVAYLLRFSDPDGAIEALDVAARVATRIGDAVMAAEVRWLRGLLLCYADRFRSGLAEMIAGIEALEAMPAAPAQVPAAIQAWSPMRSRPRPASTLPRTSTSRPDSTPPTMWPGAAPPSVGSSPLPDTCARRSMTAGGALPCSRRARGRGAGSAPPSRSPLMGLASPRLASADQRRRAQAFARARAIFAELDHHALVAFTLLDELRDVALTYDAAESRRSASARGRGGGGTGPDRGRPPTGRLAPPGLARLPRPRRSLAGGGPDPARPARPRQRLPPPRDDRRARRPRPPSRRPGARLGGDPRSASRTGRRPSPAT